MLRLDIDTINPDISISYDIKHIFKNIRNKIINLKDKKININNKGISLKDIEMLLKVYNKSIII